MLILTIYDRLLNDERDKPFTQNFKIADRMYRKLEYLKETRYKNVSINTLVMTAISVFLDNISGELILTQQDFELGYHSRSFRIRPSLNDRLLKISKKYGIPVNRLVNLAVAEALKSEHENLKNYQEFQEAK